MFDELLKRISELNGQRIPVSIPIDEKGFIDRQCPNEDCGVFFKVSFEDWKNIVRDEAAYCPVCHSEHTGSEWNTYEQSEYIKQQGMAAIQRTMVEAMQHDAKYFNSRQIPGFINISLSVKPGQQIIPISPGVLSELEQSYHCPSCQCHYSYFGTAYFCPSCGKENTEGNTSEWLRNILLFVDRAEKVKISYVEIFSKEESESVFAQILEDHFCRVVSIFQKYAEYLFISHPNPTGVLARKNLFQNLPESSEIWRGLTGIGYEALIDASDYSRLLELFQIRHLLAHTGGIVDEGFLQKVGAGYSKGQRIAVSVQILEEFVRLTQKMLGMMKQKYGS